MAEEVKGLYLSLYEAEARAKADLDSLERDLGKDCVPQELRDLFTTFSMAINRVKNADVDQLRQVLLEETETLRKTKAQMEEIIKRLDAL